MQTAQLTECMWEPSQAISKNRDSGVLQGWQQSSCILDNCTTSTSRVRSGPGEGWAVQNLCLKRRSEWLTKGLLRMQLIALALREDSVDVGDVTTLSTCALPACLLAYTAHSVAVAKRRCGALCSIPESTQAVASFLAKADGVLAGLYVAERVCASVRCHEPCVQRQKDASHCLESEVLACVHQAATERLPFMPGTCGGGP
jgi:hypothetical protein